MQLANERFKSTWYGEHIKKYTKCIKDQSRAILLGDSLVANISRYPEVWKPLERLDAVNCGIAGDKTQNVLWRVEKMRLPATVSVGVIHCGINDINGALSHTYGPREIAENVISCGSKLRERDIH